VSKIVLDRHKKSETYKQVSDCLSSEGSVNRSLSDLHCTNLGLFASFFTKTLFAFTNFALLLNNFQSLSPLFTFFIEECCFFCSDWQIEAIPFRNDLIKKDVVCVQYLAF
ncbi:hypothetical protein ABMY36_21350, partial [Vibrio vulnificus]|uniref:hypothetical protein n=1 Tax=Vibrio vulnificus TaxID=672 RepID=UPI004058CC45